MLNTPPRCLPLLPSTSHQRTSSSSPWPATISAVAGLEVWKFGKRFGGWCWVIFCRIPWEEEVKEEEEDDLEKLGI